MYLQFSIWNYLINSLWNIYHYDPKFITFKCNQLNNLDIDINKSQVLKSVYSHTIC